MANSKLLRERLFFPDRSPFAAVLLGHGLNLMPNRMDAIAHALQDAGFLVYRPAFTGHRGDHESYLRITAHDWLADAERHADEATRLANANRIPLAIVAFSFSALVYELARIPASRRIFLAPGTETHGWYSILRWVRYLPLLFSWPSVNLPGYRANDRSSLASFQAMDDLLRLYHSDRARRSGAETLILMDPKDELVDFEKLRRNLLPGAKLETLSTDGCRLDRRIHHLILDPDALGDREWARLTNRMTAFLRYGN